LKFLRSRDSRSWDWDWAIFSQVRVAKFQEGYKKKEAGLKLTIPILLIFSLCVLFAILLDGVRTYTKYVDD